jgi:hypothetical protein
MEPFTILAALAPLALDLGKSLIGKFIGSDFKPANVQDWMAMQSADIERFKALNEAGGANPSYPWVEAVIRLQRPVVGAVVLGTWAYTRLAGAPNEAVDNFAAAIGFYLFGDRTLFHIRSKAVK